MKNKIILATIFMLTSIAPVSFAQETTIQEPPSKAVLRTVDVEGQSELEITPDIARFSVGIRNRDKSSEVAVEATTKDNNELLNRLKAAGIEDQDLTSSGVQVGLIYNENSGGFFGKPDEFEAFSRIQVTVRDLEILPQLLADLGQAGANEMSALRFDISDRKVKNDEAMLLAVDSAFARAQKIAERAGMELGDPIQIKFGRAYFDAPVVAEASESGNVNFKPEPVNLSPGVIKLNSRVEIQYELVSKP